MDSSKFLTSVSENLCFARNSNYRPKLDITSREKQLDSYEMSNSSAKVFLSVENIAKKKEKLIDFVYTPKEKASRSSHILERKRSSFKDHKTSTETFENDVDNALCSTEFFPISPYSVNSDESLKRRSSLDRDPSKFFAAVPRIQESSGYFVNKINRKTKTTRFSFQSDNELLPKSSGKTTYSKKSPKRQSTFQPGKTTLRNVAPMLPFDLSSLHAQVQFRSHLVSDDSADFQDISQRWKIKSVSQPQLNNPRQVLAGYLILFAASSKESTEYTTIESGFYFRSIFF